MKGSNKPKKQAKKPKKASKSKISPGLAWLNNATGGRFY